MTWNSQQERSQSWKKIDLSDPSGREALVLEVATLSGDAGVAAGPDVKDGSVDHSRVQARYGLCDVALQLVERRRPRVVHQRLQVSPQEEV